MPVLLEGRVYGVISVEHNRVHAFDEYDLQLLEMLASQVSQAIQNARLFETRQRLEVQLERLHQVVQEGNLEQVLQRIVEGISVILGEGTSPTINLYNEQTDRFSRYHACGPLEKELQVPPRKAGTGRHVIRTGEPLYLPDVLHPPAGFPTVRQASVDMGIRSFAALPLKREGHVVGVLFVNAEKPLSFTPETKRVLELFAGQAAIAIHVSQVLERRIQQLEGLQQIGLKITSRLDLPDVLRSIAENTNLILGSAFTTIFPYTREGGFTEGAREGKFSDRPRPPSHEGICAGIVRSGEPIWVEDAAAYPGLDRELLRDKRIRSFAGVPVQFGAEPVGVILANYMHRHVFTPDERKLAEQIAQLAAVAIENATRAQMIADRERYMTMVGMAADLVHRINNRAGTIPIRAQQLEAQLSADDPKDQALRQIAQGIARDARALMSDSGWLEGLERAETLPMPSQVRVDERLQAIAGKIMIECPASIDVISDIAVDLPPVLAVPEELDHLLWSVANNGVQAMLEEEGKGGTLCLRARALRREDGHWIEIRITDRGPGIPAQMRDHLFEPFYSTRQGRFRGFGLWRARQVLRKMGGSIRLSADMEPGTTFVIELPAATDRPGAKDAGQ